MDIFQRSIHSNVKKIDDDHLLVTSSLLDLEHSIHLELLIHIPTKTIESAKGSMSKTPLKGCLKALDGIPALAGLAINRGVMKEISLLIGGPRGCAHMVELLTDALRLISMILIGDSVNYWGALKEKNLTEEEVVAYSMEMLRNSCLVFAEK
ncbi:MAG: DUF2889 domain-containing protein [Deltaproteobacteria bacterium]|nr:DUF2889 domain-containing protein [Deltaproteobacteria bacterium]